MRRYLALLVLLAGVLLRPADASAFINNIGLSVGEGPGWTGGKAYRLPVSVELVPSVSFAILKLDLGLYVLVEKPVDFLIRPGVRVCLPWVYFRAGIPLRVTHGFDWGVLMGVGTNLFSIGFASVFLEVDTSLTSKGDWGRSTLPLEFRAGIEIGF